MIEERADLEVMIVADGHYYRDAEGNVYAQTTYDYNFFKRYLTAFDKVYAVVRIENVEKVEGKKLSSGPNVEFLDLPAYTGPWEYAKIYLKLKKIARLYCDKVSCAIFRLPAATANLLCKEFSKTRKPFAVEIVADPWENFAPGSIDSILRPIIRIVWTKLVKNMCNKAKGASYVTQYYLQKKYPCPALRGKEGYFTGSYSSVELPDDSYAEPRIYGKKSEWIISHVANTFADYGKGHIPLMNALKILRKQGCQVKVVFIGDGPKRVEFEEYAQKLGVREFVEFRGQLPNGAEVKRTIAQTDIFVFPTKAEGLPRGLLEAMSEGLPCLSSPTCGIPEVLQDEYLYKYDDAEGWANGIRKVIENPELLSKMSEENIETALKYRASVLSERRTAFYMQLRQIAEMKKVSI